MTTRLPTNKNNNNNISAVHQRLTNTMETNIIDENEIRKEIAILSEKILSHPQQNLKYLKRLFLFAFDWIPTQEEQVDIVAKIATLSITSLVIIFRDIVPGYPIATQAKEEQGVTLSKETLRIRQFESQLIEFYVKLVTELLNRRKRLKSGLGKPWLGRWKAAVKQVVLPAHIRALCFLLTDLAHFNEANRIAKALIKYTPRASEQERRWIQETLMELLGSLHRVSGNTMKTCQSICQYICTFSNWNVSSIFCNALCSINYAALFSEYRESLYYQGRSIENDTFKEDALIDERSFQRDWRESQGRALYDERRNRLEGVVHSVEQFLLSLLQSAVDKEDRNMGHGWKELLELFVKVSIYLSPVSVRRLETYLEKLSLSTSGQDMERSILVLNALYRVYFLQRRNHGWKEDSGTLDSLLYQCCGGLLDCRSIHHTDTSKLFSSLLKSSLWWLNPARDDMLRRRTIWRRLLWLLLRTESPLLMNIITAIFMHGIPEEWSLVRIIDSEEQRNDSVEMLIREATDKNPNISYLGDTFYEYSILSCHFHPYIRTQFSSLVRGRMLPWNDSIEEWLSLYTDEMTFIPPVSPPMQSSRKSLKRKSHFLTSLTQEEDKMDGELYSMLRIDDLRFMEEDNNIGPYNSYDTADSFIRFYNQGLRQGIMEAQENLTRCGYWEGLKRGSIVIKSLNKYISAILVLESLNQKCMLWREEKSFFMGERLIETRKQLQSLLQKYESTTLQLGSRYVESTQQMRYFSQDNQPIEEDTESLEKLKMEWFSCIECQEKDILEQTDQYVDELVNSLEEPIQSHWRDWMKSWKENSQGTIGDEK